MQYAVGHYPLPILNLSREYGLVYVRIYPATAALVGEILSRKSYNGLYNNKMDRQTTWNMILLTTAKNDVSECHMTLVNFSFVCTWQQKTI